MYYLLLSALGLCCCVGFFWLQQAGPTLVVVRGLLIAVASLVVAHELGCSVACGIFLAQGSNPCPLH